MFCVLTEGANMESFFITFLIAFAIVTFSYYFSLFCISYCFSGADDFYDGIKKINRFVIGTIIISLIAKYFFSVEYILVVNGVMFFYLAIADYDRIWAIIQHVKKQRGD